MNINRIIVTGKIYKELEAVLSNKVSKELIFLPEEEVSQKILKEADAFVAFGPTANFDFYNLKWVHSLGAGVDRFILKRDWKNDVLLTRTICSFGKKISEYCLSYILSYLQRHDVFKRQQRSAKWEVIEPDTIQAQNIIILGTGVIGTELAKNLRFLGVKPIGVSLSGQQNQQFSKVITFSEIGEYLPKADWIISTLPLTKKTKHILDNNIFGRMQNCCLINVGRGAVIREDALMKALDRGNLQLAVLDVFEKEPLPLNSQLWENPKVIITPHISALTTVEEGADCFLDTLSAIENGRFPLFNEVDVEKEY